MDPPPDDYQCAEMGVVGRSGITWTAIDATDYIHDMQMSWDDLMRQLEVDLPRMQVTICADDDVVCRVTHGDILHRLVCDMLPNYKAAGVLACCTQTCLAAPVRGLHGALPEGHFVGESNTPLFVTVTFRDQKEADVVVKKNLRLRKVADVIETLRDVQVTIEYSTDKEFVLVGIGET